MRRLARLLPVLLAAVALAGCGSDEEEAGAPAPAPDDATRLQVEITEAGPQPIQMQLVCDGTCDLERLKAAVAGARDEGRACTLQYGGPERAHVTGTVDGRPVDVTFNRENGCGIADYEALFEAFGRRPPVGG